MQHSWRPDIARAAQGIAFVHRPNANAEWDIIMLPRCKGGSLAKPRTRNAT